MSLRRRKTLADELNEIRSRVNKLETGTELRDDSITLNTIRSVKERYNLLDTSGLSLYLGLNGSVRDGSVNKRHAILNGTTTFVTGKVGSALSFPGGNITDYIDVPNTALNGFVNFTVSFWIKTTDAIQNFFLSAAESDANNNEFLIGIISATSIDVFLQGVSDVFSGLPTLNDNVYHHIVFKRTGTEGAIFIDGGNKTTQVVDATALTVAVGGLIIGQEQDTVGGSFSSAQAFNGDMDEVRFYNRALSDDEILELFINATPLLHQFEPHHGLVGFWPFEAHPEDMSGFRNDGTLVGNPTYVDGKFDKALDCDGVDDYVAITADPSIEPSSIMSVSVWVRLESGAAPTTILEVIRKKGGAAPQGGYLIILRGDLSPKRWQFGVFNSSGVSSAATFTYDDANHRQKLIHLVLLADGTNARCFLNGVEGTPVAYDGTIGAGGNELLIGAFASQVEAKSRFWNGIIDEVRIYNRDLSQTEITELFNNIRPSLRDFTMEEEDETIASVGSSSGACTAFYIGTNPGGANDCDLIIGNQWAF